MLRRMVTEAAAGLLLLTGIFVMSRYVGLAVSSQSVHLGKEQPVVVLDSGHGA